jgi:serine/threonine protein kinase
MAVLPQRFGRYLLRELKAKGGMAEIFDADIVGTEGFAKRVAVKRTLPHLSESKSFVDMFLDEARLASKLSHPNVVQVFDFGEVEGRYFIAMEYLEGESLSHLLREAKRQGKPLPVRVVLQVMAAAADGLHHAHTFADAGRPLHIVHRDISPSNIMVTYQGGVKVVDFGIARAVDRQQDATETGIVKGKVPYCSPEQLRGDVVDARSDIFSLGIVLWELLAGQWLFRRTRDLETLMAVLEGEIPPPSRLRPDVDARLDAVVMKALERDLSRRYQSALELRRDLEALMEGPPVRLDEFMVGLLGPSPHGRTAVASPLATPAGEPAIPVELSVSAPVAQATPGLPQGATSSPGGGPGTSRLPLAVGVTAAVVLVIGAAVAWKLTARPVTAPELDAGVTSEVLARVAPDAGAVAVAPVAEPVLDAGQVAAAPDAGAALAPPKDAGVSPPVVRTPVVKKSPPAAPAQPGTLDVSCAPWCRIFVDGKDLERVSPLVGHPLPAGKHRLRFEHPPSGRSFEKELVVEPGQAVRETVNLR